MSEEREIMPAQLWNEIEDLVKQAHETLEKIEKANPPESANHWSVAIPSWQLELIVRKLEHILTRLKKESKD